VIAADSQAVLNTLTEYDFQDAFKKWQSAVIVYKIVIYLINPADGSKYSSTQTFLMQEECRLLGCYAV
jgi:hypothetical protein